MTTGFTNKPPEKVSTDILVIPVFEDIPPESLKKKVPLSDEIGRLIEREDFKGRPLETLLFPTLGKIRAANICLCGLGKRKELNEERIRKTGGKVSSVIRERKIRKVAFMTDPFSGFPGAPGLITEGFILGKYNYTAFRKGRKKKPATELEFIGKRERTERDILKESTLIGEAVNFARDLVNTPANYLIPEVLASEARKLKSRRISVQVLNRRGIERAGMGAFLAVSSGSRKDPQFIIVKYNGASSKVPPSLLIGKSVTFDSGGLSLKPSEGMEKMKYDMAGGAAVLGVFHYLRKSGISANIIGILPATENLPGGSAAKPGDIVRTVSGKSIEILNTDAEGRLTLADAIDFSKRFRPRAIIDIATLTGACSVALGNEAIALMGNNASLISSIKKASELTGERVWEMPLFEEYREYLKSDFADIKNIGGRSGSLVTAAYFLKEFAGNTPWAHLDIASTAWTDKEKPCYPVGATGVGVRLLISLLKELYQ